MLRIPFSPRLCARALLARVRELTEIFHGSAQVEHVAFNWTTLRGLVHLRYPSGRVSRRTIAIEGLQVLYLRHRAPLLAPSRGVSVAVPPPTPPPPPAPPAAPATWEVSESGSVREMGRALQETRAQFAAAIARRDALQAACDAGHYRSTLSWMGPALWWGFIFGRYCGDLGFLLTAGVFCVLMWPPVVLAAGAVWRWLRDSIWRSQR